MRQMTNGTQTLNVYGWLMLRNCWEYFLLDDKGAEDIRLALVYGDETEIGDVSMNEVMEYRVVSDLTGATLTDIAPPPGWDWVDA